MRIGLLLGSFLSSKQKQKAAFHTVTRIVRVLGPIHNRKWRQAAKLKM